MEREKDVGYVLDCSDQSEGISERSHLNLELTFRALPLFPVLSLLMRAILSFVLGLRSLSMTLVSLPVSLILCSITMLDTITLILL